MVRLRQLLLQLLFHSRTQHRPGHLQMLSIEVLQLLQGKRPEVLTQVLSQTLGRQISATFKWVHGLMCCCARGHTIDLHIVCCTQDREKALKKKEKELAQKVLSHQSADNPAACHA